MLVCTVARVVASSLLDVTQFPYRDGNVAAAHEVDGDQGMLLLHSSQKKIGWWNAPRPCEYTYNLFSRKYRVGSHEREFGEMTETKR